MAQLKNWLLVLCFTGRGGNALFQNNLLVPPSQLRGMIHGVTHSITALHLSIVVFWSFRNKCNQIIMNAPPAPHLCPFLFLILVLASQIHLGFRTGGWLPTTVSSVRPLFCVQMTSPWTSFKFCDYTDPSSATPTPSYVDLLSLPLVGRVIRYVLRSFYGKSGIFSTHV